MDNKNQNYLVPSTAEIRWLNISLIVFDLLVALSVTVFWIFPLVRNLISGDNNLSFIYTSGSGLALLSSLVLAYWKNLLNGVRPNFHSLADVHILSYFSTHGRGLWWKAIQMAEAKHEQFSAVHVFEALNSHVGVRVSLLRLELSADEISTALKSDQIDLTSLVASALDFGKSENSHISWEDLWRGLVDTSPNLKALLATKRISPEEAINVITWTRSDLYFQTPRKRFFTDLFTPNRNLNTTWTSRPTPTLEQYSQNLTDIARLGFTTSAHVRNEEVDQAIQILSKSQENNLILVGEPGVGKTAVVGDIALRLIRGDVPALKDFKLIALDINAMIGAGEDFQTIFTRAVEEASASGNSILFIGNLDQFAKIKSENGFNLSSILMSALEHKGLQLIGTADMNNYKKYIENNPNFAQFFTRLNIPELSAEKSVLVLEESSRTIENRQGVIVTLSGIKEAVKLSNLYVHTAKLPAKAEEILDESAVLVSRRSEKIVDASAVQEVMSAKTNVPVGDITADEKTKLGKLETVMSARIIGQTEAVSAVVSAMQRARLGVSSNTKRPIGSFLFLGPTGVGKTETAKSLASAYFGDETKMIRLAMSEFQTPDSVYRITGAPATTGDLALSGGAFTEAVKATPFAVILLDEIEKAHPDVLNIFLSVLDEGSLTDNLGNTVDFSHTIIIATSNAESKFVQESVNSGMIYEDMSKQVIELLVKNDFRPEFVNRFDGVIVFRPLTIENIKAIAKIKVGELIEHLQTEKHITLTVTDSAIAKLAELGYNPSFGARPLERVIREHVENFVAHKLLSADNQAEFVFDLSDIV